MTTDICETFRPDPKLINQHSKTHAGTAVISGFAAYMLGSVVESADTLMSVPVGLLSLTAAGMCVHSTYSLVKQQLQRKVSVHVDTAKKRIIREHPLKPVQEINYDRLLLVYRASDTLFLDYEVHKQVDDAFAKGYKVHADAVRIPLIANAPEKFEVFKEYITGQTENKII